MLGPSANRTARRAPVLDAGSGKGSVAGQLLSLAGSVACEESSCCWETFCIFAYCGLVVELPT